MGPRTRSQVAAAHAPPSNIIDPPETQDDNRTEPEEADSPDVISLVEEHVTGLSRNMKLLKRELEGLRWKNEELTEAVSQAKEEADNSAQPKRGTRGGISSKALQKQVKDLKSKVRELEKAHSKDKRRIARLRAKEVKREAEDLEDQADFEVGDTAYKMRKLLRRFHDVMLVNTLESEEECSICLTAMEMGKSRSFPCEHTFCEDCTRQVDKNSDVVRCPTCRKEARREELEIVEYTATKQWDELLEVAARWAKMDHRREEDTSEEEAEEEFIDDGATAETRSSVSEPMLANPLESSPEPDDAGGDPVGSDVDRLPASQRSRISRRTGSPSNRSPPPRDQDGVGALESSRPSTPEPDNSQPGYLDSPAKEKRKRMEELAQLRKEKRQRRL